MSSQGEGEANPTLDRALHPGWPTLLISKLERKQELQFANYKKSFRGIKGWIEMETHVLSSVA